MYVHEALNSRNVKADTAEAVSLAEGKCCNAPHGIGQQKKPFMLSTAARRVAQIKYNENIAKAIL
jgi:hypothetical protein